MLVCRGAKRKNSGVISNFILLITRHITALRLLLPKRRGIMMAKDEGQAGVQGTVLSHLETKNPSQYPTPGLLTGGRALHPPTPRTLPGLLIPRGSFSLCCCCTPQRAGLAEAVHGQCSSLLLRPLSTGDGRGCGGRPGPRAAGRTPAVARPLPSHFMVTSQNTWRALLLLLSQNGFSVSKK